ncbi:hypothetical protein [Burkholderia seminalis]|uniref:hypothetical protein n=1 Tax=Burkholderia seminalis TaxID=488731 RepID=UPI001903BA74|nr:hypothetical protein [Burkholderia seminalis]MBJ9966180.1 hypothetical protein [Burkholderia seminalis]
MIMHMKRFSDSSGDRIFEQSETARRVNHAKIRSEEGRVAVFSGDAVELGQSDTPTYARRHTAVVSRMQQAGGRATEPSGCSIRQGPLAQAAPADSIDLTN